MKVRKKSVAAISRPVRLLGLALAGQLVVSAGGAAASSTSERLADLGHPDTHACRIDSRRGLGELLVFQFPEQGNEPADQQKAVALLELLAPALSGAGVRYVGFNPRRTPGECGSRAPAHLFWRDYGDDWRYVAGHPARFLRELRENLAPELLGTPAEAYLAWSLGLVEQRRGRSRQAVALLEEAHGLLHGTDDPHGIIAFVLVPLIHHYLGGGENEARGQAYLDAYALVAESTSAEGEYLPMIKRAPVYPVNARRARQEGYVLLEFTVDGKGRVIDPKVVEENPPGVFADAAVEAARSFRYLPRVVDGVAVPTLGVRNLITFEIE